MVLSPMLRTLFRSSSHRMHHHSPKNRVFCLMLWCLFINKHRRCWTMRRWYVRCIQCLSMYLMRVEKAGPEEGSIIRRGRRWQCMRNSGCYSGRTLFANKPSRQRPGPANKSNNCRMHLSAEDGSVQTTDPSALSFECLLFEFQAGYCYIPKHRSYLLASNVIYSERWEAKRKLHCRPGDRAWGQRALTEAAIVVNLFKLFVEHFHEASGQYDEINMKNGSMGSWERVCCGVHRAAVEQNVVFAFLV